MFQRSMREIAAAAAIVIGSLGVASCDNQPTGSTTPAIRADHLENHWIGHFELCKEGTAATFEVTQNGGAPATVSLGAGDCQYVVTVSTTGSIDVTVTELSDPSVVLDRIDRVVYNVHNLGGTLSTLTGTNTVSGRVTGDDGVLAVFYNRPVIVTGGQGCTLGFWKNRGLKIGAWVGYSPTDSYNTVFGVTSSFGGNLLQALQRGGGGEIALGRQAVAALLNATSSSVSYDLTEAQVKTLVQGAYSTGNFEGVKNYLEGFNQQETPGFCE